MVETYVLAASIALQFTAALLALRLIRVTGWRAAWVLIAVAMAFMGVWRSVTLYHAISGAVAPDLAAELVALAISFLMVTGVALISPLMAAMREGERGVAESERHFRAVADGAPVILWMSDASGENTFFNRKWLEFTGLTRDEVTGATWLERLHPEDRQRALDTYFTAFEARETFEMEYRLKRFDGDYRWILDTGNPRFGRGGRFRGFVGSSIDITGRKRAEEALRARALQQAAITELGQHALGGADISVLMDEAVRLVARTLEVEYCKVLELLPSDDAFLLRAGVGWKDGYVGSAKVPAGRDSQAGYTLLSNEPVIVEDLATETRFSGPPVLHEHGVVSGMSVIIEGENRPFGVLGVHTTRHRTFTRDDVHFLQAVANVLAEAVTRRRAEGGLRASRQMLRLVFDAIPVRVFWKDRGSKYLGCNLQFAKDAGLASPEEIAGKTDYELSWSEQAEPYRRDDRQVIESGFPKLNYEERQTRPDGTQLWLRTSKIPLRNLEGNIVGVLGCYEDITERKRAEAALETAKDKAESANRAKSVFLATVSHELRTPLNAIIGFAELIKSEMFGPVGSEKYKGYAADIHNSGILLLDLINDILDFSKAEAGKLRPRDQIVDFRTVAEVPLRFIRHDVKSKKLSFVGEIADDLPPLRADARMVTQILINLLSNAVKFTPSGGTVAMRAFVDHDGSFVVAVSDTGIGIAPQDMPVVMSAFGRADNLHGRDHPGTGLGLPLVKSLIEAHDGSFELESKPDVGTVATVRFPADRVLSEQAEHGEGPGKKAGGGL